MAANSLQVERATSAPKLTLLLEWLMGKSCNDN